MPKTAKAKTNDVKRERLEIERDKSETAAERGSLTSVEEPDSGGPLGRLLSEYRPRVETLIKKTKHDADLSENVNELQKRLEGFSTRTDLTKKPRYIQRELERLKSEIGFFESIIALKSHPGEAKPTGPATAVQHGAEQAKHARAATKRRQKSAGKPGLVHKVKAGGHKKAA